MTIPFTYIITHVPSNVKYYGARWAKNCNPEDLGTTYFSSSNFMKKIIKEEGLENFKFEVRKIFKDPAKAIEWETKFLTRIDAAKSSKWFNKHNNQGTPKFSNKGGYKLSERSKQNMRKPKSPEHKQKLIEKLNENRVIPEWTEERKIKQKESIKGEKNHNYGKSDHPGAIILQKISLERKNKSLEEIYGYEKAQEIRFKSGNCRGKKKNLSEFTCPYCGKIGKGPNMTRYHFNNCKNS